MLIRTLAATVVVLSAACNGSLLDPMVTPGVPVMRITGPSNVAPGTTAAFTATLYNGDGSISDVSSSAEWSSSAPDVLRVHPNGGAVGISAGEANVIAKHQQLQQWLPVLILPVGTYKLSGSVTEPQAAFAQGIKGATIEVVRGTGLGIRTTTTDYSGRYELYGLAGEVQLKVAADGYKTSLVNLSISKSGYQRIDLIPQEGPAGSLSGRWTLTVLAPDCEFLPGAARSRQFFADISHTGSPRLAVKLSSSSVSFADELIGQIVGSEIALTLPYWPGDVIDGPYYALIDSLHPKGFLGFRGTIHATVDGSLANGALEGAIDYYPDKLIGDTAMGCLGPAAVSLKR